MRIHTEPAVDHIDATQKSFNVGKGLPGMAKAKLDAEMEKCQLLCDDCHKAKSIVDAGKKPWAHGTISGYRYCRCEACKSAKAAYTKEARIRKLSERGAKGAIPPATSPSL